MTNNTRELNMDELDVVSGGAHADGSTANIGFGITVHIGSCSGFNYQAPKGSMSFSYMDCTKGGHA
jgi:hypothetical protein